ncbi:hypothetical protein D3D02_04235 [Halobellus sp. Atlit-38R]|uniref:hypothetical protein n=1 Tax=Halobellus sp. Atlit-38R TaxID=2282131 RepID=UPI000EF1E4DF|nr:hypothetical protein [Halobellus sp. Atlit-38R]RLM90974.1 hypothetical protein D3D02_04235 [Halobellus sp. Atlit-38R]
MPSTRPAAVYRWLTAQRQLTIFTAIALALPTAYAFQSRVGTDTGGFLLLLLLGVGVPTAYDEYWPPYDRAWQAILWTVLVGAVAAAEFTAFYLIGTDVLGLAPRSSTAGAFLLTGLQNLAFLTVRRRAAQS